MHKTIQSSTPSINTPLIKQSANSSKPLVLGKRYESLENNSRGSEDTREGTALPQVGRSIQDQDIVVYDKW